MKRMKNIKSITTMVHLLVISLCAALTLPAYGGPTDPYRLNFRWKVAQDVQDKLNATNTKITHFVVFLKTDGGPNSRVAGSEDQWRLDGLINSDSDTDREIHQYSQMSRFRGTSLNSKTQTFGLEETYTVLLEASEVASTLDTGGYYNHHFMLKRPGFKRNFGISIVAVTDNNYLKEEQKDLAYANLFDAGNVQAISRYNYNVGSRFMGFNGFDGVYPITLPAGQEMGTAIDGWDRRIGLGTWADQLEDKDLEKDESPVFDINVIRHPFYKVSIVFPKDFNTTGMDPRISIQTTSELMTINIGELFKNEGGVTFENGVLQGELKNNVTFSHWHVLWRSSQHRATLQYVGIPSNPFLSNIFTVEVCGFGGSDSRQKPVIVKYAPSVNDFKIDGGYKNVCP